jgi:tRNA pseudouridine32 synthase / 23S rRNA pseudouridine746 synthase
VSKKRLLIGWINFILGDNKNSKSKMYPMKRFLLLLTTLHSTLSFLPLNGNCFRSYLLSAHEILRAEDVNERLRVNLEWMNSRDASARELTKDDLNIVYDDDHIIVVDKPSGVLCVSNNNNLPSLCKAVYETFEKPQIDISQMVVHRLGMDTSGLIVFCKSIKAVKGMNRKFRLRQVLKQYEALVCGVIPEDEGVISMPLMRDYVEPPYMRISTDEHQLALAYLDDPAVLPKKFMEPPKPSLTRYNVLGRESLGEDGLDVTRVTLSSVTGRTHQLNVHLAAFGHPIVADAIYGWEGRALPNGGLTERDVLQTQPHRASPELQQRIADYTKGWNMCIHATFLSFRHPVTKIDMTFQSPAPF